MLKVTNCLYKGQGVVLHGDIWVFDAQHVDTETSPPKILIWKLTHSKIQAILAWLIEKKHCSVNKSLPKTLQILVHHTSACNIICFHLIRNKLQKGGSGRGHFIRKHGCNLVEQLELNGKKERPHLGKKIIHYRHRPTSNLISLTQPAPTYIKPLSPHNHTLYH